MNNSTIKLKSKQADKNMITRRKSMKQTIMGIGLFQSGVRSVECGVRSVELENVECGIGKVELFELGVRSEECGAWSMDRIKHGPSK